MSERRPSEVPCGSCALCCHGRIFLFPTEETTLPTVVDVRLDGAVLRRLRNKPNGECAHLGRDGCTVYDQRPQICQRFDCRDHYHLPAAERRRREAILTNPRDRAIIERGRELLGRKS
jgi:Fe-S-cluster containining protein